VECKKNNKTKEINKMENIIDWHLQNAAKSNLPAVKY
jgi:hypothetical protein